MAGTIRWCSPVTNSRPSRRPIRVAGHPEFLAWPVPDARTHLEVQPWFHPRVRRGIAGFIVLCGLILVCWQTWAEPPRFLTPAKRKPDLANIRYGPHDRNCWTSGKPGRAVWNGRQDSAGRVLSRRRFPARGQVERPRLAIAKCLSCGDLGRFGEVPAIGYGHVPRTDARRCEGDPVSRSRAVSWGSIRAGWPRRAARGRGDRPLDRVS